MSEAEEEPIFTVEEVINEDGIDDVKYLILHKKNINLDNAISLNEALIDRLKTLLGRLEESLVKCQAKYEDNERIRACWDANTTAPVANQTSFKEQITQPAQYCGAPYFKTRGGKYAPPNAEALYRRSQGTVYPMDFKMETRTQWTMADKTLLLRSIKQSIWRYCRTYVKADLTLHELMSLADLVEAVKGKSFELNWQTISDTLCSRHSPFECQAMWKLYLHPKLKRGKWTDQEDDALLHAARANNFQNWEKIAATVGLHRSMFQCFLRYQTNFTGIVEKTTDKFSPEEDARLLELVNEHRVGTVINWTKIAQFFQGRTKQSVYYRYIFSLQSHISRERFSVEEDCIFLAALQEYGVNFQKIAREFPNRTVVQLRAHYNSVLKRNSDTHPWTVDEDKKLMAMHKKGKTWAEMAKVLETHSRQMCRARYLVIKKHMDSSPKAKIEDVPKRKRASRNQVTTKNWAEKITELGKTVQDAPKISLQNVVLKLASFIHLLDVQISDELIEEFKGNFLPRELEILKNAVKQDPDELMDIPMHRPTLVAFQNVRDFLAKTEHLSEEIVVQETYSKNVEVERENFKKQFKALFYLPAILSHVKQDSNVTFIDSPFGRITVSYDA